MTLTVPTRQQIAAQVEAVLEREPEAQCIAIHSPARDSWPETLAVRERGFRLRWCESALAARQLLTEAEHDAAQGLVLLTHLRETELGSDVIARLSRGRVFQLESWEMVRRAFQAKEVDSRLARRDWMASVLLENAPAGGYPPVPGGFLDLDTAWRHVLEGTVGLGRARPDLITLLRWSLAPEGIERYARLSEVARAHVYEWLADGTGPVGGLVMAAVAAGGGLDALPIGLVCGVVFASMPGGSGEPQGELTAAAVRLERFTGGRPIRPQDGRRWAEAAAWVVRHTPSDAVRPFLERADGLLHELHLSSYAARSDVLPSGFEARMTLFAESLGGLVANPTAESMAGLEQTANAVLRHDLGRISNARTERVRMSLRLGRWVAAAQPLPTGFAAFIQRYAGDGAFVDWARIKLLGGDELAALSTAYAALSDTVRARREAFNRQFAQALKDWNATGLEAERCVTVESVLEALVGPLAQQAHVLLLVVDGLSFPIFQELYMDLGRQGWSEHVPEQAPGPWMGIAALPTVTEISRASLLAGRIAAGAAGFEKSAFSAHAALLASSKASAKPVLFHKGELGDGLGLSQAVRDAVGGRERRVVAIVYNAVDDHLSGSNQLSLRWSLDDLRLLKPLLHEARTAGRVLIVTADHGHVIDEKTTQRGAAEGDRWRSYAGPVQEGEIVLAGGRVRSPTGATRVVCAWSECLRYGAKKNGYHGGVSPQEVIVPLGVLLPPRVVLEGWKPAPPAQPEWWEDGRIATPRPAPMVVPEPKGKKTVAAQGDLFHGVEAVSQPDWISLLLETTTYQEQRQLAARVAPPEVQMRQLLEALDARGGKLSKSALAQRLGIPLVRVGGLINAARRVVNVDQSPVLSIDEASGTVELNRELLEVQFQLRRR